MVMKYIMPEWCMKTLSSGTMHAKKRAVCCVLRISKVDLAAAMYAV